MDEWEQSEVEEWVETEPILTIKTAGVVCVECGAVNAKKHHMPKGEFSHKCPKCRRKESNRNAQRTFQAKWRAARDAVTAQMETQPARNEQYVNSYFNRAQAGNSHRIKAMESRVQAGVAKARTLTQLRRRYEVRAYYEAAREAALRDLANGELRTLAAYLSEG